jgi:hypothetical protein
MRGPRYTRFERLTGVFGDPGAAHLATVLLLASFFDRAVAAEAIGEPYNDGALSDAPQLVNLL